MTDTKFDVSVVISFHDEGLLAKPSIHSLNEMAELTRMSGRTVEIIVALDRASSFTTHIVETYTQSDWRIFRTDFGDPGLVRNYLISKSSGRFLSILDGDDLWSRDWLLKAIVIAEARKNSILHPEFAYYFYESDFDAHSPNSIPHPLAKSHFVRHQRGAPTQESLFAIRLHNPWSAHCFASREIFESIPYRADSKEARLGIEDWVFNAEALQRGYAHEVVPDTVHMLRQRMGNSQNIRNMDLGVLPDFRVLGDWPIGLLDEG